MTNKLGLLTTLLSLGLATSACGSGKATDASTTDGGNDETGDETGGTSTDGTTTDGTTTDETTTDATDTDGCSFLQCNDMGGDPTCDPGLQDCNDGEKCTAYVVTPGYCCVDANKCVEDKGDKQLGDVCTREPENDDCDKGLFCMTKTSGDTGEGVCLAFCDVNDPGSCTEAGLPDATCIPFNDGILPLCEDDCDPLAQDCTQPQGCYAVGAQGFVCTLPGYDDGKGNDNDECYTIQSCKAGLICANGEGQNGCNSDACCTPFCDVSGDHSECGDPMEECVAYFEDGTAPPGYENVGICYIPA